MKPHYLCIGLLVHNKTRKRGLIDILYSKGLSVSYERVLQFTTDLSNHEIQRYECEKVICPSPLRNKVFTTGCLDNIDHNPSSTSSHDSFHGTAISVTQHITTSTSKMKTLPVYYSEIPPVSMNKDVTAPKTQTLEKIPTHLFRILTMTTTKNPMVRTCEIMSLI